MREGVIVDYCTELGQMECHTVLERSYIVVFERLLKQPMDLKTDSN